MNKVLSGRWLLTVAVGMTYAFCAITGKLDYKDVVIITLIVMKEYFERKDRNGAAPGPNQTP